MQVIKNILHLERHNRKEVNGLSAEMVHSQFLATVDSTGLIPCSCPYDASSEDRTSRTRCSVLGPTKQLVNEN